MTRGSQRRKSKMDETSTHIKLDLDTVLQLVCVDNLDEVRAKYKPLKIIDEGLSDCIPDKEEKSFGAKPTSAPRPTRKRGRPPSAVKETPKKNPLPSARVGWGAQALRESTPYRLLHRSDLFEQCRYIMDHEDYVWCQENGIDSSFFTDAMTELERKHAMHLILTAKGIEISSLSSSHVLNEEHNDNVASIPNKNDNNNNDYNHSGKHMTELCGVCSRAEDLGKHDPFLRCVRCKCQAHVRCWLLESLPPNVNDWRCPCCTVAKRVKTIGQCHACGRQGGVMLPLIFLSESKREVGAAVNSLRCHIVCALAFEGLTIDTEHRVVLQSKRLKRLNKLAHCSFCHSENRGGHEKCHHTRCFEYMHPSCAQEAGTLECDPAPHDVDGGGSPWKDCRLFCRAHAGVAMGVELVSVQKGEVAHAEVLRQVSLADFSGSPRPPRRGRPPNPKFTPACLEAVKKFWVEKRQRRRQESEKIVKSIQEGRTEIVSVALRPEVIKITPTEVRLARFLCLVPELQYHVNARVEGVLPLPDDEYDDVEEYRKNHSRTRHAGNTLKLYGKMQSVASHLKVFSELIDLLYQRAVTMRELLETDLELLDAQCRWKEATS